MQQKQDCLTHYHRFKAKAEKNRENSEIFGLVRLVVGLYFSISELKVLRLTGTLDLSIKLNKFVRSIITLSVIRR